MTENFFGITDRGKRRDKNEDTFIAQQVEGTDLQVACVIDGVGGYSGGEVAAGIARSVILQNLATLPGDIIAILKRAIVLANEKIFAERKTSANNESMACVLTIAITDINNNKFYYAHVGDTRIYLLRDNSLIKISKDHSVVGFLEESGRLSEVEAMRHPRRNEINKALGFEAAISDDNDFIEAGESPFLPGDILLLCSDGLTDMISTEMIRPVLSKKASLAVKARELVDAANDAGGNDNITAVLVENYRESKVQAGKVPAQKKNESAHVNAPVNPTEPIRAGKKNNTGLIVFLTLLSLALAFAFLFTLFKDKAKNDKVIALPPVKPMVKTDAETRLIDGIHAATNMYAIGNGGIPITLSGFISISADSFHLLGNGHVLTNDSNYKGPALVLSPSIKQVLLDSLVFKNFDVAIVSNSKNMSLRNIRFINCRVPVQYNIAFNDSMVTGRFADSFFIRSTVN